MIQSNTQNIENRVVMRPTTFRLPLRFSEALKRAAEDEGQSEAAIVREALRRKLGKRLVETR